MTLPEVNLSAIDEQHFGIRTARTTQVTTDNLAVINAFCRTNRVRMLIARCPVSELEAVQRMERDGFLLMDTLMYYSHHLQDLPLLSTTFDIAVRPFKAGETEAVRQLAVEAFHGYFGHYHADARLDRAKCDDVYISWAYRSCLSREVADEVLVAELDGRLLGFITIQATNSKTADGRLLGVAPSARGTGVAQSLMVGALAWCKARGLQQMLISTQITNLASQKVWVRLGFEPDHAYYTLHKWFE